MAQGGVRVEEVLVSVVRQLYQLQLVDSEWTDRSQRLVRVEEGLGESQDLIRAREAVVETEGNLGELGQQMRALELDIATVNLQEEAEALRRRISELEDEQLELMIGIEEAEAELAERQARLRQIEDTWRAGQASLQGEKDELELRLLELGEERNALRAGIGVADLAFYDDLRQRHGGTAVVHLRRGICQTCGVDVPTSVARAVERGEGRHYCPVCSRLLFSGG
jgi:predicted  nucleic acid-binding Zn-ribbon protein